MELIAIAPKTLLSDAEWREVEDCFEKMTFVDMGGVIDFDYNHSKCEKVLLIDPDYIDWNFPNEVLRKIKNLKCVCLTTTTASYVDEHYLKSKNIELLTVPKYSTDSVAEYLVFLMMCLAKKLPLQLKNSNKQDFTDDFLQIELKDKIVGVVGLGNIGERICEIVNGFGMIPIYYNRTEKKSKFKSVSIEELFKISDVVFITLANNPETKHIVTDEMLKSMKRTAILISGTGVELHNDDVVRQMLKNEKLFGFGAELPNRGCEDYEGNAMITSEYAWFTEEATQRRKRIVIKNLRSTLREMKGES